MSSPSCENWQGDLALAALGRLESDEQMALSAHLSGCTSCRTELAELESVIPDLALADPRELATGFEKQAKRPWGPSRLPAPGRIARLGRPRPQWALGGLGAAVVLAVATLLSLGTFSSTGRAVTLHGMSGVQATAVLTAEHWGTDLSLQVTGQPPDQVFRVAMQSTSGTWWQAGSYRSENGSVHVQLACGVDPTKVNRIWIENTQGKVVLSAYLS